MDFEGFYIKWYSRVKSFACKKFRTRIRLVRGRSGKYCARCFFGILSEKGFIGFSR